MVRVAVVGYGTIGRRVADAVARQPDLELAGVAVRRWSAAALGASARDIPVHRSDAWGGEAVAGARLAGDMDDLLGAADVVVDCGQRGTGASRRALYQRWGLPTVLSGGEHPDDADATYSALVNHDACRGVRTVRVATCNLTAIARAIGAVSCCGPVRSLHATLVRCASDPDKGRKGRIADAILVPDSKHGREVRSLFPDISATTTAISVPMTAGHLVSMAFVGPMADREAVLAAVGSQRRVRLVEGTELATSDLRDRLGAGGRQDCTDLVVPETSVIVSDAVVHLSAWVHMEAIVIPDTVDAIRAVGRPEIDAEESITLTDRALRDPLGRPAQVP